MTSNAGLHSDLVARGYSSLHAGVVIPFRSGLHSDEAEKAILKRLESRNPFQIRASFGWQNGNGKSLLTGS